VMTIAFHVRQFLECCARCETTTVLFLGDLRSEAYDCDRQSMGTGRLPPGPTFTNLNLIYNKYAENVWRQLPGTCVPAGTCNIRWEQIWRQI
jgi:hypothetical protein